MLLKKFSLQKEMQTTSPKIWTRVTVSISYDDDCYIRVPTYGSQV